MTIDKLVALGKKLYAIVEAGKPVVDVNMNNKVSVLLMSKDLTGHV